MADQTGGKAGSMNQVMRMKLKERTPVFEKTRRISTLKSVVYQIIKRIKRGV